MAITQEGEGGPRRISELPMQGTSPGGVYHDREALRSAIGASDFKFPAPAGCGNNVTVARTASVERWFARQIEEVSKVYDQGARSVDSTIPAMETVVFVLRALREFTLQMMHKHLQSGNKGDAFFSPVQVPSLTPVLLGEVKRDHILPFLQYLDKLVKRHPEIYVDPVIACINTDNIMVAALDGRDANQHLLIIPTAEELMLLAQNGQLLSPTNY